MYLKSLELHGFKSFPERTVLKFNSGSTIIVGPNGSGKSNITDAMRWVLGELSSKSIRGNKMEDVIFAGADDRKPMSFAEVSVTFDDSAEPRTLNVPYDEVTVTRRYYRSGDSEYFINRKKARLRDIYELFMNTGIGREGYSIIGQGKIAEIISKKSDDRRGVFEESAGIAKYRYKKTESEKKLAATEANMERVGDIEHELSMRIGPLEKDAEKARRYLELYGEKKKTDISLWMYDAVRLKDAIEKTENDTRMSAHELEMAEDSIRVTSAQIERLYEQSHSNKEESRRNYDETTAENKRLSEATAENKLLIKEKIHGESTLATEEKLLTAALHGAEIEGERAENLGLRLGEIGTQWNEIHSAYTAHSEKLASLDRDIKSRTAELEAMLAEQKKAENELTEMRVRINVLQNHIEGQKKQTESIDTDIRKYRDEIAALSKTAEAAEEQISAYQKVIEEIEGQTAEKEAEARKYRETLSGIEAEARKKQAEIASLESRIAAMVRMQEHFDGYNDSIKYVMNEAKAGRLMGIRGPLSQLIKVNPAYIVAIETSLGGALQNIVTDDENAAKRSIEALKRSGTGRATFYPLTTIRPQERGRDYDGLERTAGFVGWGDELVSSADEYRNIVRSLLGRVVVYDTLDHATEAARAKGWRIRCVTLDGQQINAGGSFTGGKTKRDSGMLSRAAQIDSMEQEKGKADREYEDIRRKMQEMEENIASCLAETDAETERRGLIDALVRAEQQNYSDMDGRRKALTDLVEGMEKDKIALKESSVGSADELKRMEDSIAVQEADIRKIAAERDTKAAERGERELEFAALTEESGELRIRLAELTRDKEAAEGALAETMERANIFAKEAEEHRRTAAEWRQKIESLSKEAKEKQKEAEARRARIEELTGLREKLAETGDAIDTRINALRKTEQEQHSKKELINTAHTKNEAKLQGLQEDEQKLTARMWDDYELTYAAAVRFAEENDCHVIVEGERTSFQTRQNELKSKIRSLGHVNVDAIEEYNEVKQRYEYIRTQLDDLRKSKEDLLKILSGIEEDMKTLFLDAFEKINRYFGEVFRELFGGGHAEVVLTDPENALESGIEINAAPPGKNIKNLSLLSGGEQAFIAIALLFALIRVNPSPFCIFDEIEAALDEVNVTRVGRYIKKYSEEMQIIMITHRRGTMDIADTLYGVTMQQSGVSRVFTLGANDDKEALLK